MLAAVLVNFGGYDEARKLLADAERLLDSAGDFTSIERARLLRWQGSLDLSTQKSIPWEGHPLRGSIRLLRERYSESDDLLAALSGFPTVACRYGHAEEAMAGADELYTRTVAQYGKDNLFAVEAIAQRANVLQMTDRASEAVPMFEEALAGLRKYVGDGSPNVVAVLTHLAEAYETVGRTADSQRTLSDAHQVAERDPGDQRLAAMLKRAQERIDQIKAGHPLRCGQS
jgi:tetratricopeptide (TPR) repeat protein